MNLEPLYELIRRFEGCHLTPYLCPAGVLTCGWGSTGPDIVPGRAWTQEYADERLKRDAARAVRDTLRLCPGLSDNALCAIADFTYNLGAGRLQASTLRRELNSGDFEAAARELDRWVWGGGRKLRGLVIRRAAEARLLLDSKVADT